LLIVAVITMAAIFGVAQLWRLIGGDALTLHGWIAVSLGVFFTVAMAWGLMGLAFRSSREGFDQRAVDLSDLNIAPAPATAETEQTRDTARP
jgi:hypothetical protein